MRLPDEVVADRVVPTIRHLLARRLLSSGLTQGEVADRIGVSQAAVSGYASARAVPEPLVAADPRVQTTVERLASGLAAGTTSPVEVLSELVSLVRALENRGPVCVLHERESPELAGLGCDLCVNPASKLSEEQAVFSEVARAARAAEA
ncbi:MAG: transcriptional regulator, partial [Methanobacteriota archaeon]